ncbi:MAG: PspC domain-containing protein [Flavobacteriales bacterium]|jgi:phage shock protein PspC (stress-responsive transcriptional regulator)|nr:PspC domain-containing protein [Flavobacteriales bacterium]
MNKPLQRSDNKVIAGVCAGIAEWKDWDPTIVRIIFVVLSFFTTIFPGLIIYLILWIVMPRAQNY